MTSLGQLPYYIENPDPTIYLKDAYVVLDFETTNYEKGFAAYEENSLVLSCWTVVKGGHRTKKHVFGGVFDVGELLEDLYNCEFIVAHNAKFELQWLDRCGFDIGAKPIFCTQIADYIIAGNRKWRFNLDACLKRWGIPFLKDSLVSGLIKDGVCPSNIDERYLLKYCWIDVDASEELFLRQRAYQVKHGLLNVMYARCLFTPVLADIEMRGMVPDLERVKTLYLSECNELHEWNTRFNKLLGNVNPNSPKQMAQAIYVDLGFKIPTDHRGKPLVNKESEEWPDGVPKSDKDTIAKLKPKNKKQREFIEVFKNRAKMDTRVTWLKKLYDCAKEDGILYANLNQTIAATHRLTSTGKKYAIQYQNMNREFKPLFKARHDGWIFEEDDVAQFEYRFYVNHARDVNGMAAIEAGEDVHYLTASTLFDEYDSLPDGSAEKKALRTEAKADTFKPLYYGRSGTPKQRDYYKAFIDKHEQIGELQEEMIGQVVTDKQLRIFTGLVFYWPHAKWNHDGSFATYSNQICNYFCQNGATAEGTPFMVTCMWHRMRSLNLKSFLVNTVHDSVESEVHPDETEIIPKLASHGLTVDAMMLFKKLYDYDFVVPMETESEIGSHWGTTDYWEEKYLTQL